MKMVETQRRSCFHCGEKNHLTKECPLKEQPRLEKGRLAFEKHLEKKENRSRRIKAKAAGMYHFYKWRDLLLEKDDSIFQNMNNIVSSPPSSSSSKQRQQRQRDQLLMRHNTCKKSHHEFFHYLMNPIEIQLKHALFPVEEEKSSSSSSEATVNNNNYWTQTLNQAVKLGRPPIESFSNIEQMKYYTLEKFKTRTRYLFYLILHNHHFDYLNHCSSAEQLSSSDKMYKRLRKKIIQKKSVVTSPPISSTYSNTNTNNENNEKKNDDGTTTTNNNKNECTTSLRIMSLGGGPGFDHVAIWMVFLYLKYFHHHQEKKEGDELTTTLLEDFFTLHTNVFDLFDTFWEPIMKSLHSIIDQFLGDPAKVFSSLDNTYNNTDTDDDRRKEKSMDDSPNNNIFYDNNNMTMHHCDIRQDIHNDSNKDLKTYIGITDIFCFQFVLHENSDTVLSDYESHKKEQKKETRKNNKLYNNSTTPTTSTTTTTTIIIKIQGIILDILKRAKVGSFIICTDSNNFIWKYLVESAKELGWISSTSSCNNIKNSSYTTAQQAPAALASSTTNTTIEFGPKSYIVLERLSS